MLYCEMRERKCIYRVGLPVNDGVPCSNNDSYRCINGVCQVDEIFSVFCQASSDRLF